MPVLPLWLLNLARNKWAQRAALALGVVVLLLGARAHYIHEGRRQGSETAHAEATQQQAAKIEEHRTADRTTAVDTIGALQVQIQSLAQSIAGDHQVLLALATQRQQAAAQVAGMSPDQVQQLINRALERPANSTAPYTAVDQEKIGSCFAQLLLCNKQVDQLTLDGQRVGQQVELQNQKYEALVDYTVALERDYAELWNLNAKPHRAPTCLWLWHCRKTSIPQPDPKRLQRPARK
jgi:hypothetical protein